MNYRAELYRKSFHLLGLGIPAAYFFLDKREMITGLVLVTFIVVSVDFIRFRSANLNRVFMRIFGVMLRAHEHRSLSGSTYLMTASLIAVSFFSREIAIISILFAVVCDAVAAVIGKRFGRIRIFEKSLEGSLAFLATALIIAYAFGTGSPYPYFIGAFAAALIELLPIDVDDNFLIPVLSAVVIYVSGLFLH